MGIRKPKEPKKILEELVAELARDYARWNEILEHGGSDRFYPDGTGLELKRNHVINDRRKIAELCWKHGLALPEGMGRFPVPPEMPQNYMARNGAHFSERVRRIRELDPGFEPVFGTCAETGDKQGGSGMTIWEKLHIRILSRWSRGEIPKERGRKLLRYVKRRMGK